MDTNCVINLCQGYAYFAETAMRISILYKHWKNLMRSSVLLKTTFESSNIFNDVKQAILSSPKQLLIFTAHICSLMSMVRQLFTICYNYVVINIDVNSVGCLYFSSIVFYFYSCLKNIS